MAELLGEPADAIVHTTRTWLERAVVGLSLCPFAKAPHVKGLIRYFVSDAEDEAALLSDLEAELTHLIHTEASLCETTLLIAPRLFPDFLDFNDFLTPAEAVLERMDLEGEIQLASFHPDYRFAGNAPDAMANYVNRAPYPILHLLRESSVDVAVEAFPDPRVLVERNVRTLEALGPAGWRALLDDDA